MPPKQVDFITIDGYNYAGSWETQTNDASPLFDSRQDPVFGQDLDIDDTVDAYLKAGVPPLEVHDGSAALWRGLDGRFQREPWAVSELHRPFSVPLANGTGLCTDLSGNTAGCDPLLTAGPRPTRRFRISPRMATRSYLRSD